MELVHGIANAANGMFVQAQLLRRRLERAGAAAESLAGVDVLLGEAVQLGDLMGQLHRAVDLALDVDDSPPAGK